MLVLGIETSCDECSAAIVEDGSRILSNIVATQIPHHAAYSGVVPELASRIHSEWIAGVVAEAIRESGAGLEDIGGVGATSRPGLLGSLAVGLSFAKALAFSRNLPFKGINHMLAHLYAPQLEERLEYPFIGLLVSGGHSIICIARDFDRIEILGTTMDDAAGEAFDKVAKHYGFGYPGGKAIDELAERGDDRTYAFPLPSLHKGEHRYDLSYSGLKTAVIHHLESYRKGSGPASPENICASFRKTAVDILLSRLFRAVEDSGIHRVVAGGGVAANAYLRRCLARRTDIDARFPSLELCGDNGAMVAGLAYRYFARGETDGMDIAPESRVPSYKRSLKG